MGWEYLHVCVDDATRLAYAEVLPDEKAVTATGFLNQAEARVAIFDFIEGWYNRHRRRSALGQKSPINLETQHLNAD